MLYQENEIIAMAIVYEGHLPQGYTLDKYELASEIIDRAHQSGLPSEMRLSLHTAIRAQRANESEYYAGSYEPIDDLPAMLKDCLKDVHEKMIANGEIPGPMSLKSKQFKSWSSVASTVWVSVHIRDKPSMYDQPVVSGVASASLGQLDVAQATGSDKETTESDVHIRKGKLWKATYWSGVLMLIFGCLMIGLTLYSMNDPTVVEIDWLAIIGCTGPAMGLGGLLVYFATRPTKPKQSTESVDV